MRRAVRVGRACIEYELIQTMRRNIELRVADDAVKVFAPRGVRLSDADAFVRDKADWVMDALEKMRAWRREREQGHALTSGARIMLKGCSLRLNVVKAGTSRVFVEGETLYVEAADDAPEAVRQMVRAYMIECARDMVGQRLAHFAPLIGREPNRITIREQRTRWGSCSSKHNLNFNWKLIMAPPGALDYVVVHELCHLHAFNHSDKFWAMVERFLPDYREWKQWLKQNGALLGV